MKATVLACALVAAAISCSQAQAQNCPNCQAGQNCPGGNCKQGAGCKGGASGHGHLKNHPPKNHNANARYRAAQTPWHGNYYYTQWGAPVALVAPPTVEYQTDYSWGVPASRVSRIDHQFQRGYPGAVAGGTGYGFLPTPQFPNDTRNFGVYYVRGPW